jgi:RimJ/RimL family protein N-acetyltransferase
MHIDDVDSYLGWLRDVDNNPFIQSARVDYRLDELRQFIGETNRDACSLLFGIFLNVDGKFIGTLKVAPIDFHLCEAWVGLMIGDPDFRGLGYGRESLSAVLTFLFQSLKMKTVFLGVNLDNVDAISLYRGLGFAEMRTENNSVVMKLEKLPNFE